MLPPNRVAVLEVEFETRSTREMDDKNESESKADMMSVHTKGGEKRGSGDAVLAIRRAVNSRMDDAFDCASSSSGGFYYLLVVLR